MALSRERKPRQRPIRQFLLVALALLLVCTVAPLLLYRPLLHQTGNNLFAEVDVALQRSVEGKVAYNSPEKMQLGETVEVEVLLSPVQSGEELAQQISVPGRLEIGELQVTERMQATLRGADAAAFSIQPHHSDPVQLLSTVEAARWRWSVQARKHGTQSLILTIERFVRLDGQEYLRPVQSFENTIIIDVTPLQWVQHGGWVWIVLGVLAPGIVATIFLVNRRRRGLLTGTPGFLTAERYAQVRRLLLSCGPFADEDELRAVFSDPRIRHWLDHLPDADSAAGRVDVAVDFLSGRSSRQGENGLVLLLMVLRDRLSAEDACHAQLSQMAESLTANTTSFA